MVLHNCISNAGKKIISVCRRCAAALIKSNSIFENLTNRFSKSFLFDWIATDMPFRQLVMLGGHHWLPEIDSQVLSGLWAVRSALQGDNL
jgi:hypothetical protein